MIYESSIINFPRSSESSYGVFISASEVVFVVKSALDFVQHQFEDLIFFFISSITFGFHTKRKKMMNPCRQFRASVHMNMYKEFLNAHEIDSMDHVAPIMMNNRK